MSELDLLPNFPQNMEENCTRLLVACGSHRDWCRKCTDEKVCDEMRKLFASAWDYIGIYKNLTPDHPLCSVPQ